MTNKLLFPGFALVAISLWGCGPQKENTNAVTTVTPPAFTLTVTADTSFPYLPPLQSFVFENHNGNWIMFSGRTNGFHGFSAPGMNFPKLTANPYIYVYNSSTQHLDSLEIPTYGGDTGNVFLSTNLAHTAKGGYLYACGGYGIENQGSTAKKTYDYFMQMQMDSAIAAVQSTSPNRAQRFKNSIIWGKSPLVCSTGGELYVSPSDNFYMCVGHKFSGNYSDSSAVQEYVNNVNVFRLNLDATKNSRALSLIPQYTINDGLPNENTQFHRRDLVVAPSVQANGTDLGLAIYGGVFTYTSNKFAPASNNGTPFKNPIYIDFAGQAPYYKLDSFSQWTNVYSTAFLSMYDTASKSMITSLFGGLGDSVQNFASANWTTMITSNIRSFANGTDVTTSYPNAGQLPEFIGAEGVFIPDANVPYYNNFRDYKIINYQGLTDGQTVGHIYGGIKSFSSGADTTATTMAWNKVYKVVFNKTAATAAKQ